MARYHAERSRLLQDAVASGHVELARTLLAEQPQCIAERSPTTGDSVLHRLPADGERAQALIGLLLAAGADPRARNRAGQTAAEALEARGLDEIADLFASELD
jgi:hypothetical protein